MRTRTCILIITLVSVIAAILLLTRSSKNKKDILSSIIAPKPTPRTTIPYGGIINLTYLSQRLRIYWAPIPKNAAVYLVPNYTEREFAETITNKLSCHIAINGGFYKGDGKPLGLLITNGNIESLAVRSTVANGYFWQNRVGKRLIGKTQPDPEDVEFAFQSGPFISIANRRLSLVSDERARRSLLGVDEENNLYAISITSGDNAYGGASLADIPVIFSQEEIQQVIPITTLLNLDGGGASFFYVKDKTDEFMLSPLSPVGSVICVRM